MSQYLKLFLMIATSTLVMFVLMYLNTYQLSHVFFSETRTYMALYMGAMMAVIMLLFMLNMYKDKKKQKKGASAPRLSKPAPRLNQPAPVLRYSVLI